MELWWPNGHGDQVLYLMSITFSASGGKDMDTREVFVGFRTVELVQDFVDAEPPGENTL